MGAFVKRKKLRDGNDSLSLEAKYDISQLQRFSLFSGLHVVPSGHAARKNVSLRRTCISVPINTFHSEPRSSEDTFCTQATRVACNSPSGVVYIPLHVPKQSEER